MNTITPVTLFFVGIGAPANLYTDYLDDLKKCFPETKLQVIEWWNQPDFGIREIESYIDNSELTLIAHSAGGVIALQVFEKWFNLVKKIIIIDSHFLRKSTTLASIPHMLDTILNDAPISLKNRVEKTYAPLLKNDSTFNQALLFAIEWTNNYFENMGALLKKMEPHSALYIGCTNSSYQPLNADEEKALNQQWGNWLVDTTFLPMNHFNLIDKIHADIINQVILNWLTN